MASMIFVSLKFQLPVLFCQIDFFLLCYDRATLPGIINFELGVES